MVCRQMMQTAILASAGPGGSRRFGRTSPRQRLERFEWLCEKRGRPDGCRIQSFGRL